MMTMVVVTMIVVMMMMMVVTMTMLTYLLTGRHFLAKSAVFAAVQQHCPGLTCPAPL